MDGVTELTNQNCGAIVRRLYSTEAHSIDSPFSPKMGCVLMLLNPAVFLAYNLTVNIGSCNKRTVTFSLMRHLPGQWHSTEKDQMRLH